METIEYRGYKIRKLEYDAITSNGNLKYHVTSYIILSEYYIGDKSEENYLPLYCYDEYMEPKNFFTLDQAKEYVDKYLVGGKNKMEIRILHRDEISNVPKSPGRPI